MSLLECMNMYAALGHCIMEHGMYNNKNLSKTFSHHNAQFLLITLFTKFTQGHLYNEKLVKPVHIILHTFA